MLQFSHHLEKQWKTFQETVGSLSCHALSFLKAHKYMTDVQMQRALTSLILHLVTEKVKCSHQSNTCCFSWHSSVCEFFNIFRTHSYKTSYPEEFSAEQIIYLESSRIEVVKSPIQSFEVEILGSGWLAGLLFPEWEIIIRDRLFIWSFLSWRICNLWLTEDWVTGSNQAAVGHHRKLRFLVHWHGSVPLHGGPVSDRLSYHQAEFYFIFVFLFVWWSEKFQGHCRCSTPLFIVNGRASNWGCAGEVQKLFNDVKLSHSYRAALSPLTS